MNQAALRKVPLINIPTRLAADIVSSIHSGVEEMREEVALTKHQYVTNIQETGKFWDILNTRIYKSLQPQECALSIRRIGFWQFLLASYNPTGMKFSFMKERRFRDMQSEIKRQGKLTYPNIMVQTLNKDLQADTYQMTLFPIHNYDKETLAERVEALIKDFLCDGIAIGHYMLVLFDCDASYELRGVRAVIVDPNLNIVEQIDWSQYIPVKESSIVEKVSDPALPSNNPSRGLTLTDKAYEKKLQAKKMMQDRNMNSDRDETNHDRFVGTEQ